MTAVDRIDPSLQRDIESLAPAGLLIGHRLIAAGDENELLDEEAASIASSVVAVRRASGTARLVARELLARLGHHRVALPKAPSGAPIWPTGIVGSIAHDENVAVAAVGLQRAFMAVGIDVEPATPLPSDTLGLVAAPDDLRAIEKDPLGGKLLFAIKEAVYKAVSPLDGVFLEFRDITVDPDARNAVTRNGRTLALRYCLSSRIVVLAYAGGTQP